MPIQPGTDIGRYHILEQLGEGGMAVVYKAYDTHLESDVAIKILRAGGFPADSLPRILKRFQIEAKKMAQLNHTNIIKVMDYGEFEGSPYLVMPYIPGGTLKEKLGKPMPWKAALRIVIPIANSLAYAHEKGLIHRDVKPSNILITHSGEPMLSDFGVAKVLESDETLDLTFTGTGVGTPEYMAPEQAAGKNIDPRVDIYALGVVLYEMLTGRVPFTADTPMAVIIKQATEPLPNPRSIIPDLPEEVERLLFKALSKNPADRFESMGALVVAIENLNIGRAESKLDAIPYKAIGEEEKKSFDPRWLLGLAGVVCAGLIIYLSFFMPDKKVINYPIDTKDTLSPSNAETLPAVELNSTITNSEYLADMEPEVVSVGFWNFSVGKYTFDSIQDGIHNTDPIILQGKYYEHGLFVHAPSLLVYRLNGQYRRLDLIAGKVGVCKGNGFSYYIEGDNKILVKSDFINELEYSANLSIDVTGIQLLKLVFEPGTDKDCDWTMWGDPILFK